MTVTELQTAARDVYNATGDTFFSDAQINNWMRQACNILAKRAHVIERVYTTTTVASTQDYAYPTNTIAIKRITYNGIKLKRITQREDDVVTLANQSSTQSGTPYYYTDWNYTISLRPIPSDAQTLKIYSYNLAQEITNTSTIEVPAVYHMDLVNYIVMMMFAKDKDTENMSNHKTLWEEAVMLAQTHEKRKRRTDSFSVVQDEGSLIGTMFGEA